MTPPTHFCSKGGVCGLKGREQPHQLVFVARVGNNPTDSCLWRGWGQCSCIGEEMTPPTHFCSEGGVHCCLVLFFHM